MRRTGSGLGPALAARLVGRLNGAIEAGHAPESGVALTMTFPCPDPSAALIRPAGT